MLYYDTGSGLFALILLLHLSRSLLHLVAVYTRGLSTKIYLAVKGVTT